jgi:hypothetical protein
MESLNVDLHYKQIMDLMLRVSALETNGGGSGGGPPDAAGGYTYDASLGTALDLGLANVLVQSPYVEPNIGGNIFNNVINPYQTNTFWITSNDDMWNLAGTPNVTFDIRDETEIKSVQFYTSNTNTNQFPTIFKVFAVVNPTGTHVPSWSWVERGSTTWSGELASGLPLATIDLTDTSAARYWKVQVEGQNDNLGVVSQVVFFKP